MIGGAVLVVGLLLILAGLLPAIAPGGAAFASPGVPVAGDGDARAARGGNAQAHDTTGDRAWRAPFGLPFRARQPVRAFVLAPIHPATWYANAAIFLGVVAGIGSFAFLTSIMSAGLPTIFAGVGILLLVIGIEGARVIARIERRRARLADPRPLVPHAYRPFRGGIGELLRAEFADESRWRDVLYIIVNLPLSMLEFAIALAAWWLALALLTMPLWYGASPAARLPPELGFLAGRSPATAAITFLAGAALLPVAASVSQLVAVLHRAVVSGLLCTSESRELRRQVETLRESRSAVLDAEASELRRIERDLHDGAQQRLVMLTIDLGLASERIDADPEAAKRLVLEGRDQARLALAEIRDLVRGIAPAILLDRGLVPAIWSIAARSPVQTVVASELPPGERLPEAVERAAYFVVAEGLANVAKHSGAHGCEVRCRRDGARLILEIEDDGAGGARVGPAGGLAGLAGRVAALDGSFAVSSPPGGPTVVRAELPVPAPGALWGSAPRPAADASRSPGT